MHPILKDKKVVLFDLGGTLEAPASGDWMLTNAFWRILGRDCLANVPRERRRNAWDAAMTGLFQNHLVPGVPEEIAQFVRFYKTFCSGCGLAISDAQAKELSLDRALNMENYCFFPDAAPTIEKLAGDFRLGVVSDTWPSVLLQLGASGMSQYFQGLTFSCALGVCKPDARMFQDALRQMNALPEETVFVDDLGKNLVGAAALGITPVQILAMPETVPDDRFPHIRSVSELLG